MSAQRDYAVPAPTPYGSKEKEANGEDIRHIEEVPNDHGIDISKEGATTPVDHYTGYPVQTPYTGRWAQLRFVLPYCGRYSRMLIR